MAAIKSAISEKTITAVCSDHQPHNEDAKQAPFSDSQFGIASIEILFPLIMELVDLNIMDLNTAISKVTSNPANILGIDAGIIKKGSSADICILKKEEWVLDFIKKNIFDLKHKISKSEIQYNRPKNSVLLMAVSKTQSPENIIEAFNAGQRDFGENYIQESIEKISKRLS